MSFAYWLILGVVLVVLEIAIPSFVVIWFGVAALLTGIASFWVTDLAMQTAIFVVLSALSFVIGWFGFLKNAKSRSQAGQGKESVLGEGGIVSAVKPGDFPAGRVRFSVAVLGSDEWEYLADEPLAVGDRCVIVDVLGSKLKVRKA
jgi:membrane protein implicated in regulation of membrane protease activity